METLEQLIERLKTFQIERGKLKNRLNSVDRTIKDTAYKIDKLTEKSLRINPAIVLKNRDISICLSFIKENRRVTSKQLIDHLNNQLIDKDKRWKTVFKIYFNRRRVFYWRIYYNDKYKWKI